MDILKTINLTKNYNKVAVVKGIDIQISSGEIIGLLGRNGAGKTTTFLMLSGIVKPNSGSVLLNGENINDYPSYLRAAKGLIYLPQQHSVFLKTTVYGNLFQILELYHDESSARKPKNSYRKNNFGSKILFQFGSGWKSFGSSESCLGRDNILTLDVND